MTDLREIELMAGRMRRYASEQTIPQRHMEMGAVALTLDAAKAEIERLTIKLGEVQTALDAQPLLRESYEKLLNDKDDRIAALSLRLDQIQKLTEQAGDTNELFWRIRAIFQVESVVETQFPNTDRDVNDPSVSAHEGERNSAATVTAAPESGNREIDEEDQLPKGCHRSHPHEDMSLDCERLTEIAELQMRLRDCEQSLSIYDGGRVSEYWLRYDGKQPATVSEEQRPCRCNLTEVGLGCEGAETFRDGIYCRKDRVLSAHDPEQEK